MESRRAGMGMYTKTRQKESPLSQSQTQVCKANRLNTFQELATKEKDRDGKEPPPA